MTASPATSAQVAEIHVPITNFAEVAPEIYRSARPDDAQMAALADQGLKTDLDLENDKTAVTHEARVARSLGLDFISKPMSGFWEPHNREVDTVLSIVSDPARYPILIHCEHGQDRTGLIVGLYRVLYQKEAANQAYEEMKRLGFHPILLGLEYYFWKKTGLGD